MTVCSSFNGTNAPLIVIPDQTIDTAALIANLYTLGPVTVNTVDIPGVQSMTFSTNIEVEKISESGSQYPTLLVAKQARPVLRLEGLDLEENDDVINWLGTEMTALTMYLRKRKQSQINYDDGDTVHIKFTATKGTIKTLQTLSNR
jgi:hypothetical protein